MQVSISYLHTREGRRADKRRYLYGTGCISSSEFRGLGKKIRIVMEGLLGRTAQDGHLDSHIAPELCVVVVDRFYMALFSALEQTHCARMGFYMSD